MSAIIDLKKGRFLDHPIHTILIHFPSALLPTSVVLDALGFFTEELSYARAAYYTLTGGVWLAVLAAVFGFMDYLRIPGEKTAARKTATLLLLVSNHLGGDLILREGIGLIAEGEAEERKR